MCQINKYYRLGLANDMITVDTGCGGGGDGGNGGSVTSGDATTRISSTIAGGSSVNTEIYSSTIGGGGVNTEISTNVGGLNTEFSSSTLGGGVKTEIYSRTIGSTGAVGTTSSSDGSDVDCECENGGEPSVDEVTGECQCQCASRWQGDRCQRK